MAYKLKSDAALFNSLPHGMSGTITPISRLDIHTLRDFAMADRGYTVGPATPLCYVCRSAGGIPHFGRVLCPECIAFLTIRRRW